MANNKQRSAPPPLSRTRLQKNGAILQRALRIRRSISLQTAAHSAADMKIKKKKKKTTTTKKTEVSRAEGAAPIPAASDTPEPETGATTVPAANTPVQPPEVDATAVPAADAPIKTSYITVPLAGSNAPDIAFEMIGRSEETNMVAIIVDSGDQEKCFLIHKVNLKKSPVLTACLSHDTVEARDGVISLPQDDPDAFKQLFHYFYHDSLTFHLPDAWTDLQQNLIGDEGTVQAKTTVMINAYVMAEKYGMEGLQNEVVDALVTSLRYTELTAQQLHILSEGTAVTDPFRAAVFQNLAMRSTTHGQLWLVVQDVYTNHLQQNRDAMEEFALAYSVPAGLGFPYLARACRWHTHRTTPQCL